MADALLFTLPAVPRAEEAEAHWWRIADAHVASSGTGVEWIAEATQADRPRIVALAPAASVRLSNGVAPAPGASSRQMLAVARIAALEASLGDSDTLHAVSGIVEQHGPEPLTAVVDNGLMLSWIDWARALGVELDHVVPLAAILPANDGWVEAVIGSERLVGRGTLVMPNEPALAAHIVGDAEVRTLDAGEVDAALAAAAVSPPLDLRSGRFAKRRRILVDRGRLRELALLAAMIPLLILCWSVANIVKLERGTARLDSGTLAISEAALGRPVALENAEAELRQRAAPGSASFVAPLSALYARMQPLPAVSATEIGYRSDGTLSVTLAAATIDPINSLLVQLQRDGYAATAVPRQAADGRATVDITVRSGL